MVRRSCSAGRAARAPASSRTAGLANPSRPPEAPSMRRWSIYSILYGIQSIKTGSYCPVRNHSPTSTRSATMSRLSVPNLESDTGPSGQVYAQIKKAIGSVPNTFAAIAAHGPGALKSVLFADATLAAGTLTKRDQEVIKLVISAAGGCDYCVAAH